MNNYMMTPSDLEEYMRERLLGEREALRALESGGLLLRRGNVDATKEAKALHRRNIENYEKVLDGSPAK